MRLQECQVPPDEAASAPGKLVSRSVPDKLRHSAPKLKTECLACRRRRIIERGKARPSCRQRCETTGRPCGENTAKQHASAAALHGCWKPAQLSGAISHPSTPAGVRANARERQVFDLLRSLTVKQVTGPFRPPFWSTDILRAAGTYPVIFRVSLAMAALNHRMRIGHIDNEAGRDYHVFALRQSNAGILELIRLMRKPTLSYEDREAILLASVLFTGISCLQRNLNQALMHVRKALQVFNQWRFWLETVVASSSSSSSSRTARKGVVDPRWLLHLISYLEYQAHEIDASIAVQSWRRHLYERPRQQQDDPKFASVAEAYYEYMPLHFGSAIRPGEEAMESQIGPKRDDVMSFENIYSKWRLRFQQLERDCAVLANAEERLGVAMLRLLVNCERLCRYLLRNDRPETWIRYQERFKDIVDTAEKLLQEESDLTGVAAAAGLTSDACTKDGDAGAGVVAAFSFSLSVVEVLRLVGFVCRKGAMRRRVLRLLRKHRRCDGLWDGELSAALIEAKMLLEERTMAGDDGSERCACVVDVYACMDHRGRVIKSDMVSDKVFRARINSKAGQARGDADGQVLIRWD